MDYLDWGALGERMTLGFSALTDKGYFLGDEGRSIKFSIFFLMNPISSRVSLFMNNPESDKFSTLLNQFISKNSDSIYNISINSYINLTLYRSFPHYKYTKN